MATEIHSSSPSKDSNTPLTTDNIVGTPSKGEEDLGISLSENEDDDNDDKINTTLDKDDDYRRIEKIDDENPHLMAYLDHSDSYNSNAIATSSEEDENNDDDADLDDSRIEAEEEQAIRADYKQRGKPNTIPGPVSLRRLSQSQQARTHNGADSDDSDASEAVSDNSSWGNDFLEEYFDLPPKDQRALYTRSANNLHLNKNDKIKKRSNSHSNTNANGNKSSSITGKDDGDEDDSGVDDSYLWQYFFSSDENTNESNDFMSNPTARARQRRLSRSKRSQSHSNSSGNNNSNNNNTDDNNEDVGSTDDDLPMKGRGPLPPSQMGSVQPAGYIPSGDSTDEDDGVPPERKRRRARGAKAIEVLGSNSFSARPPILGSWRIKGDKNVGIIDGLTTRTLSPPPSHRVLPTVAENPQTSSFYDASPSGDASQIIEEPRDPFEDLNDKDNLLDTLGDFTDFGDADYKGTPTHGEKSQIDDSHLEEDVSDLDLLELGDFINTEAMSSDENDGQFEFDLVLDPQHQGQQPQQPSKQYRSPLVSPYLYRNRMSNRNAPIPAFRNRGSPYVSNAAYPSDNFSPAPRRLSRRGSASGRRPHHLRDMYHSPGNVTRKKGKKTKSLNGSRNLGGQFNQSSGQDGAGEQDFIGELIEIGAISPLFEIDQ